MRALSYLVRTKLKNQIRTLVQKPGRLIYALFLLACLVLVVVAGGQTSGWADYRSLSELTALALAMYLLMFVLCLHNGFSQGGTLFRMSDVNFLFTAPMRPQTVLVYGLLQQMGTSLLVGFFLLFQYGWLHSTYGVSLWQLAGLLVGYALATFLGQVTAMVLYIFTSGSSRRKMVCKTVLYVLLGCLAAWVLAAALPGERSTLLERVAEAANAPLVQAFPVAGWLSVAAGGMLGGKASLVLLGLGLCGVYFALLVLAVVKMNPDFYEDVLQSTETVQSVINARKEGTEATPQRVKVGKTGLERGWGASVFFAKHQLENRRVRNFLLSTNQLIFAGVVIGYSVLFSDSSWVGTFAMAAYLQIITIRSGRFSQELKRPYLYLVPEPPMKKLLWSLLETLPSAALEALVIFVPVALVLHLTPVELAACVAGRLSFTVVYTAADVAVRRLWGGGLSRMVGALLFLALSFAMILPGLAAAVAAAIVWDGSAVAAVLAMAAANLPLSLLLLFLCRNMLQYAELNNQ